MCVCVPGYKLGDDRGGGKLGGMQPPRRKPCFRVFICMTSNRKHSICVLNLALGVVQCIVAAVGDVRFFSYRAPTSV